MLTLYIGNIYIDIVGNLPSSTWKALERHLSFRPQGYQFTPAFNRWREVDGKKIRRVWDGWKRQFWKGKKRTYFPTGLFSLAKEFLNNNNIPFTTVDTREKPDPNFEIEESGEFSYYPYQIPVIDKSCNIGRGILQAATGSGKTVIGGGIIAKLDVAPFMFFVTSIDLLTQAKESLQKSLLIAGKQAEVGQIGGGVVDIKDINVCTIQTAVRALGKQWDSKYKFDDEDTDDKTPIEERRKDIIDVIRSAKGSIADEIQHWRSDTCQLVARELKSAYYTFGMSATPFRDEGDDMLIQACFGKVITQITASQLIREGYLIRPDIKMVHVKNKKSIYKQWQSLYKDQVVENDLYNGMIANIANAYIKENRLVLVLIRQIAHGKLLESMIPESIFLSGSSSKKSRERGIKNLRNKYVSCIISSTIFDEGVDVKPLDTVILAGQGKSRTRALQRIGRILRTFEDENGRKKTKATAIDFCLHQKYLKDHAVEREKVYRTEPEFQVEDIDPSL